ncbi:MAG: carboxypeptidase-like regulatory domain-containing protein [Bacteroidota bacterium]
MASLFKTTLPLFLLLTFCTTTLFAQRPLTKSRQSSYYTYLYRLTPAEVLQFYKLGGKEPDAKSFHTLVDSFKTDKYWENKLPAGNYLKVRAQNNKLEYTLIENHSAFLKMFTGNLEQRFALADKQGNYLKNATVKINGRILQRDNGSDSWHFKQATDTSIIQADYAGTSNFFSIIKRTDDDQQPSQKSWLSKLWVAVKQLFKKRADPYNYKSLYSGFITFNKPIYKPGDTVKFKAFILNAKSSKPVTAKKLLVKIGRYNDDYKTIGVVNSYRDGGFEYSFKLVDSLDLSLDNNYSVKLVADIPRQKKQTGDDNDEQADGRKNTFISGEFKYEEYELKAIHFDIRTDKKEHWQGNPLAVYIKATDENNLPVADGRVTLTLETTGVNSYKDPHTFVRDTLWVHKFALDAVGETKVLIPDSIFPQANINYTINSEFLNSNNERQFASEYATYNYERFHADISLASDSLKVTYQEAGKPKNTFAYISALDGESDTLSKVKVNLPGFVKVNPNAVSYNIETDSVDTDIELKDYPDDIALSGERSADSVFVQVANPRNLQFFYSVFAGAKLIDAGQAQKLFYRKAYRGSQLITFVVNYTWAGQIKKQQSSLVYWKNKLNIAVKQPVSIYPGQKVQTDIVVTDVNGKPVPNTDVTAWAVTRKFENYNMPFVPYLGTNYRQFKHKTPYRLDDDGISGGIKLDWARWGRSIGLDSIEYFKFTHPKVTYQIQEPGLDTITQIAPFVTRNGDILPVHILYIDERPVFFSQAKHLQPYSFKVSPGRHSLRFRTGHEIIKLDSVVVEPSKKLILSLNADAYPATKMPDTLTYYEAELLNKYMVTIVNNFEERRAIVAQNDRLFFLNPKGYAPNQILVGPLTNNYTFFECLGSTVRQFTAEPGYSYLFTADLLRQKSIPTKYPFNKFLSATDARADYTQYVLTNNAVDSLWQNYLDERANTTRLFNNEDATGSATGQLIIDRQRSKAAIDLLIKNAIIYKYDEPDFIQIFPGNTSNFGTLAAGRYRILFTLKGDAYDIKENIEVKAHGINHYQFEILPTHKRDSVSIKINNVINNRNNQVYRNNDTRTDNDALKLKEAFNEKYLNVADFKESMTGVVLSADDKLPLPGVSVIIKGTTKGTATDINGRFKLNVPAKGTLTFAFIGYYHKETRIEPGKEISVMLNSSSNQLQEVVVVGYGTQRKMSMTGSVSTITTENLLMGSVAGLTVTEGAPGAGMKIMLRGNNGYNTDKQPLYVVDGEIVSNLKNIKPGDIGEISVLKDAAGTALYGSMAANGVVVITTKKKNNEQAANATSTGEQTLRKNFSDYAYWQPKLTTNENGKVSFTSVFPDDITNWRTFVVGINGNKQSGYIESQIKSFKPLSANFIAPQFAIAGDEMNLIGKVMNYNSTTATVNRSFIYNGKTLKQDVLQVTNAKIDTLNITAGATDSLTFEYNIKRDNGYFDGERRTVPVFKQGVKETKGIFEALQHDTTITLRFDPAMGPVTFRAEASVLPALAEEAAKLRAYKYLCNEQLASKLIGLLVEKRIKTRLNEPFKYEKNVLDIIKKLRENRKTTGTWGWWKDSNEELWISLHAIEALVDAKSMGYDVLLYAQKLTDYLVYQLESYNRQDKLTSLQILHKLKAKVDYAKYTGIIAKEYAGKKTTTNYDRLKLLLLKQETGATVETDSLPGTIKHTLFGNIYWGDNNYRFFDNAIQQTILAYKIIRNEGKHPELLEKIRGYFLEQRRLGEWRNTYEAALILETILPEILGQAEKMQPSVLTIKGAAAKTITKFPYTDTLRDNQVSISKTGTLPVYVTAYQQFWNSKPEKVSKDFVVTSWFEKDTKKLNKLKGGEAVQLKVEVTAKGDGDYVMIEVPIPAGCSYQDKAQQWTNNEVHREHFKEKVSIFCSKLKQGTYTFTVSLMPRYSGSYTLNPAKAELMYFPVFYGREGMKKVVVGD